jgi:hypothetical protein
MDITGVLFTPVEMFQLLVRQLRGNRLDRPPLSTRCSNLGFPPRADIHGFAC